MKNYKFVFVNSHLGHEQSYSLIETNIPLSALSSIEKSQNLTRFDSNSVDRFVEKANSFYYKQEDKFMKIIIPDQKEIIEDYPMYFGEYGNY